MTATRTYELVNQIESHAREIQDHTSAMVKTIDEHSALDIAVNLEFKLREVYCTALTLSIWPLRYIRNRNSLSSKDQITLADSNVAVIGTGGLGGHILHLLARTGIGNLLMIDQDTYDETNLNRQLFCTAETIGEPKSNEVERQLLRINPAVETLSRFMKLKSDDASCDLLSSADVIVDALDNDRDRRLLSSIANDLNTPLVHGAVAGFTGHVMTLYPGDSGLDQVCVSENATQAPSAESVLGTPAVTPSVIGSMMVVEIIKILLKKWTLTTNTLCHVDLISGEVERFRF